MEITSHSTEETKKLAQQIASELKGGSVLALYGELGAGKTTFTRFLVEALDFDNRVQSPTFVISRIYQKVGNNEINRVNHIDLYRIVTLEEVQDLGLHEYFDEEDAITVLEWPEIVEEFLPEKTLRIYFTVGENDSRKILIKK